MIHLLLINIPEEHSSSIINKLIASNITVDHLTLNNQNDINQKVTNAACWDAIILSENPSGNFSQLKSVADQLNNIPVIFFSEKESCSPHIFTDVMKSGARDCISKSDIYRLPAILQRELSANRLNSDTQDLTESSEVLSGIVNLSTNDIFLFDPETYSCCYANETAISNLRYGRNELKKMTALDIYPEYDIDAFSLLIQPMLQDNREKVAVCTNIARKTGVVFPAEVRFKKIIHEETSYILAINKNISNSWYKVRKLKHQRSLANNYINKHKQKEKLLANAAHDMRTSLQSIILSNKLLFDKQSGDFQQEFGKFQKAIHFSGKHLLNYINEFFDPSKENGLINPSTLNSDSLDLQSSAQNLFLVFKPIAQRNDITFQFKNAQLDHSHISTNQTYVKRILKNLLSNAFKFTNEGSVTFEVYSLSSDEIANTQIETDYAIAFRVKDTGIGIPKDQLKKIFSRHSRTKNSKKGSGLGLNICRQLSNSLGGEIEVESEINKGSVFTLYLPVKKSKTITSSNEHQQNDHQSKKTFENQDKTILIVDDSEVHNLALKEYLEYTFKKCVAVNSLAKAEEQLHKIEVDCIVSDYTINDYNCLGFLETLNENQHYSDIPIIVYTGKKLSDTERAIIMNRADAIVKKNAGSYDALTNTIISFFRNDKTIGLSVKR